MKTTVEVEGILFSVEYEYEPGYPSTWDPVHGGEPGQLPGVNITSVTFQDSSGIDHDVYENGILAPVWLQHIENQCYAEAESDINQSNSHAL